jgi:hypothetical protein
LPRDPDIDRLLDEGLSRYGTGDLDGALVAWEGVLEREPDNARANSYVDYVRSHYETLAKGPRSALPDDPELLELELEPDEPELDSDPDLGGSTRRFPGSAPDFDGDEERTTAFRGEDASGSFPSEGTPAGFQTELTGLKQRELGFVQPAVDVQPRAGAPDSRAPSRNDKPSNPTPLDEPPRLDGAGKTAQEAVGDQRAPAAITAEIELASPTAPTQDLARPVTQLPPELEPIVGVPTQDLGLRPPRRLPTTDESPTREADVRAFREQHAAQGHDNESIEERETAVLGEIDASAPEDESLEERTRRRITRLMERALVWSEGGEHAKAVAAAELALTEQPNSPLAQKLIHRNRDAILQVFQTYCGALDRQPELARPLQHLGEAPISPRAAFLLSRIDGALTIDEILDVSGMPRLETYRYLCQLFLRRILK